MSFDSGSLPLRALGVCAGAAEHGSQRAEVLDGWFSFSIPFW